MITQEETITGDICIVILIRVAYCASCRTVTLTLGTDYTSFSVEADVASCWGEMASCQAPTLANINTYVCTACGMGHTTCLF